MSILLLLGIGWNALLGASNGIVLHLHNDGHDAEHVNSHEHDTVHACDIESTDDCCYDSTHVTLNAEELSGLRLNETAIIKSPAPTLVAILLTYSTNITLLQSPFYGNILKRERPTPNIGSIISKTIVLRV